VRAVSSGLVRAARRPEHHLLRLYGSTSVLRRIGVPAGIADRKTMRTDGLPRSHVRHVALVDGGRCEPGEPASGSHSTEHVCRILSTTRRARRRRSPTAGCDQATSSCGPRWLPHGGRSARRDHHPGGLNSHRVRSMTCCWQFPRSSRRPWSGYPTLDAATNGSCLLLVLRRELGSRR